MRLKHLDFVNKPTFTMKYTMKYVSKREDVILSTSHYSNS